MKKYKWVIIGFLGLSLVGGFVFVGFQNKNQSLDINSSFVQDLYQNIVPNKQAFILKQLYDNELSDDYKINIGILSLVGEEDPGTISALEVEQSIKELLGDDATAEHKTIQFFINGHCGYTYDEENKEYIPFDGCGGIPNEYLYQKLLNAQKKDDKVIIQEQILDIFKDLDTKEVYIYNDVDREKLIDTIQEYDGVVTDVDKTKYIDKGSIYEYTFRKEKDRYVLESIKKVG